MAATLTELRAGIVSVLENELAGWNIYHLPPDNVDGPAVAVMGFQMDPGTFGDTAVRVNAELLVIASHRHRDQLEQLDQLLSPSGEGSLWLLFDGNPTLDNNVAFCTVSSAGDYRQLMIADIGYYCATVNLSVML
jgi:hypothetical protein